MQVLSDVLCGDNQAVLNKVLLEKGLAENVYLAINDGELQNWCQLEVDHIKEENLDQVKEIVFDTLQTLIKKGIDRQQLEATLAYLELNLKERNFGDILKELFSVSSIRKLALWRQTRSPFRIWKDL